MLGSGQCSAANPLALWNKLAQGAGRDPAAPTATSGRHFDAKVLAKLFQKHECEHGVGHEADTGRHEALREKGGEHEDSPGGRAPPLHPLHSPGPKPCKRPAAPASLSPWRSAEHPAKKTPNNEIKWKAASQKAGTPPTLSPSPTTTASSWSH